MSSIKSPIAEIRAKRGPTALEAQTADLLSMAAQLGPRDVAVLAAIVRRTVEIAETDGEEVAIAVIDQILSILVGRKMDA